MALCRNWIALIAVWMTLPTNAETTTVAVAANFTAAMNDIVAAFEKASGHDVNLAFGSSGKLYAQIVNGAPFDAFFSADQSKPTALENAGMAVANSRFTYAVGTLALWSAKPNLVDHEGTVLKQGHFIKLAIANPKLAPYGIATVETLKNLDLMESTQRKWVQGENIAQTYQFVATGNADLGFVALSQVIDSQSSFWIVPQELHKPIRQDVVLLRRGESNQATRALLQFFRAQNAVAIIHAYGYHVMSRDQ